jgi:Transposase IS66 family
MGRRRSAGRRLCLCPRSQSRPTNRSSGRHQGDPAGRWLRRLWQAGRAWQRSACIFLVAHAAQLLRTCHPRSRAHCGRGSQALSPSFMPSRRTSVAAAPRSAVSVGNGKADRGGSLRAVAPRKARVDQPEGQARRGHPLCGLALGGPDARFIDDGRIGLDNNAVERSIRPITLNRNYVKRRIMRRCSLRPVNPLSFPAISEAALYNRCT